MNSSIINISEILNNAEGFLSSGFSGGYNFDNINAAEYFDELIENSSYASPVFSGILIMQKEGDRFTIIDGLQRVTTVCLLLCALCENYKNTTEKNTQACTKIFNRYLINDKNTPKLKLNGEGKTIYKKILFHERLSEKEEQSNLYLAYRSFLFKVREHKISGTEFFNIISKIKFMVVLADSSDVPSRELYQAINSKDKSQVNLISDYLIQKGDEQLQEFWLETVDNYKKSGLSEVFENFMRDFLVIQNEGKTPNRNALYNNFKSYFTKMSKYMAAKNIIETIVNYSRYYLKIFNADFEDEEIRSQINLLNEHQGQDAYPYLMEVLDDLENAHLDRESFLEILTAINIFVKSKYENPGVDMGIDFTNLSAELNKMLISKGPTAENADENKLTINEMNKLPIFEV